MRILGMPHGIGGLALVLAVLLVQDARAGGWTHDGSYAAPFAVSVGQELPLLLHGESELRVRHEDASKRLHAEFGLDRKLLDGGSSGVYGQQVRAMHFGMERRYSASGSFDLLGKRELPGGRAFSLDAYASYAWEGSVEQPFGPAPDDNEQTPAFGLRADLGGLVLSAEHGRTFGTGRADGPSRREQGTHTMLSAYLPLRSVLGERAASAWWLPRLSYSITQFDVRRIERRLEGPDSLAEWTVDQTAHYLGADWSGKRWNLSLGLSHSDQAETSGAGAPASYGYESQDVTLSLWPTDALSLFVWGASTDESFGTADGRSTLSGSLGVDWRFRPGWTLSASFSPSREVDEEARSELRTDAAALQVEWQLPKIVHLPHKIRTGPARAILRATGFETTWHESRWGAETQDTGWSIGVGIGVDFF